MSSGKGPSDEYKTAYKNARAIWRQWTDALDMESGRMPERVRVATQFDGEEPATITWGEFAKANADMAPEGLREIAVTIARGEVFHGGGGAAPGYTVRAV